MSNGLAPDAPSAGTITLRSITPVDAGAVAALHATSWRRAYRGILGDDYLDGDLLVERRRVWDDKLARETGHGWIASAADTPIGFVYVQPRADARWGTLVDNLHVLPTHQGLGIGRRLLHRVGRSCADDTPDAGIHLWVFTDNGPARAFYRRMGGTEVEAEDRLASDGRLLPEHRVAWASPAVLLEATTSASHD